MNLIEKLEGEIKRAGYSSGLSLRTSDAKLLLARLKALTLVAESALELLEPLKNDDNVKAINYVVHSLKAALRADGRGT